MILPVSNILDGTWASGNAPEEWEDFQVMRAMGWSWSEFDATPAYVRKFCRDFLALEGEAHRQQSERARHRA